LRIAISVTLRFSNTKIKNTVFKNTQLHETEFTECDLTGSLFDNCDLAGATFDNTNLEKADFSTAFQLFNRPGQQPHKKGKICPARCFGFAE
jgi:fluoroquinolone resistance protein